MTDFNSPRYFPIIPAAGESRRMGMPKLLLPVHGKPLIAHTIAAWLSSGLTPFVVVRSSEDLLADTCREHGAKVVQPAVDPPEMKISVHLALEHINQTEKPQPYDAWLLAPADMPGLSSAIIRRLVMAHAVQVSSAEQSTILVPTLASKRGHPVLFPWPLSDEVAALGADEGINAIVARHASREIACDDLPVQDAFADIDTPADYERLQ